MEPPHQAHAARLVESLVALAAEAADGRALPASLAETPCNDLRVFARTRAGATAAVSAGAFVPLLSLVSGSRREVRTAACLALTNCVGRSAAADSAFMHAGGLPIVIATLSESPLNLALATAACGVLQNVSADRPAAQEALGAAGGVVALLGVLDAATDPLLAESACRALAHTCQLPANQTAAAAAGGLTRLLDSLGRHRHAGAALAACAALQNVTADRPELQAALGRAGGATALVGALSRHGAADARLAAAACSALSTIVLQPSTHAAVAYAGGVGPLLSTLGAHASDAEVGLFGCRVALALLAGSPDCAAALLRDRAGERAAWGVLIACVRPGGGGGTEGGGGAGEVSEEDVAEAACTLLAALATVVAAVSATGGAAGVTLPASPRPDAGRGLDDTSRRRGAALASVLTAYVANPRLACAACTIVAARPWSVGGGGSAPLFGAIVSALHAHLADVGVVRPAAAALAALSPLPPSAYHQAGEATAPAAIVSPDPPPPVHAALVPLASALDFHLSDATAALPAARALAALAPAVDAAQLLRAGALAPLIGALSIHAANVALVAAAMEVIAAIAAGGAWGAAAIELAGGITPVVRMLSLHVGDVAIAAPACRCLLRLLSAAESSEPGTASGSPRSNGDASALVSESAAGSGPAAAVERAGGLEALAAAVAAHSAFDPSLVAAAHSALRLRTRTAPQVAITSTT